MTQHLLRRLYSLILQGKVEADRATRQYIAQRIERP